MPGGGLERRAGYTLVFGGPVCFSLELVTFKTKENQSNILFYKFKNTKMVIIKQKGTRMVATGKIKTDYECLTWKKKLANRLRCFIRDLSSLKMEPAHLSTNLRGAWNLGARQGAPPLSHFALLLLFVCLFLFLLFCHALLALSEQKRVLRRYKFFS